MWLIAFLAAVVWPAAIATAEAQDGNDNGVPDDIDLVGKVYWTDGTRIRRANLVGSNVEDLVTTGVVSPRGIALHPAAGEMYWTDVGIDMIKRANLDGTNVSGTDS